jgi:hypothetical protein
MSCLYLSRQVESVTSGGTITYRFPILVFRIGRVCGESLMYLGHPTLDECLQIVFESIPHMYASSL